MIMNRIYIIVAILMFVSFVIYDASNNEGNCNKWKKVFHYVMQWVFFISNVLGLILININPYTYEEVKIFMIPLYGIPIMIYIVKCICYFLKIEEIWLNTFLWIVYSICLIILIISPKYISSEKILQSQVEVVDYSEIKMLDILGKSVIGKKHYIVLKYSDGAEVDFNIETRTYKDDTIVRVYPHQENAYIKTFSTIEKFNTFFGTNYQEEKNKIYEVYLTDDIYNKD